MSDKSTRRMIEMYQEEALDPPGFLSSMFRSPPQNFHSTEKIEVDIERDGEPIAIAVSDLTVEGRKNEATKYTNKELVPPVLKEIGLVTAFDAIKRMPGVDPFTDPNFGAFVMNRSFKIGRKLERKIRRTVELMASQILGDGVVTLLDTTGNAVYSVDFAMQASHKITASPVWATDGTTGDPIADIGAAAQVIRKDGKLQPTRVIFGRLAFQRFLENPKVKTRLFTNVNSLAMGGLNPTNGTAGETFAGRIIVDNYVFDLYTHAGYYEHPQTGVLTPYVPDNYAIVKGDGRLDLTWGAIPRIVPPEGRVLPFIPDRMSMPDRGMDLNWNAWLSPNGEHVNIQVGARPLTIPTAIDTFARIQAY